MMQIQFIEPLMAIHHWGELYKLLALAVDHSNGELDETTVKERVATGETLVALVHNGEESIAAVAFELIKFHTGKRVLNIQLAGGKDAHNWIETMDECAQMIARERDCDDVYIVGRAGWQRMLKPLGYSVVHTILHKEVE